LAALLCIFEEDLEDSKREQRHEREEPKRSPRISLHVSRPNVFVSTSLADTTQNRKLVEATAGAHRQEMIEGRVGIRRLNARPFSDAWQGIHRATKESPQGQAKHLKRIQTSGASLCEYFGKKTIFLINDGDVESYKVWRLGADEQRNIEPVKPVTVRHDLDNLSLFFQSAKKHRYCRENLVLSQEFEKPSDDEGIERAYMLSIEEERTYFAFLRREGVSEHGNLHDVGRLMIQQDCGRKKRWRCPRECRPRRSNSANREIENKKRYRAAAQATTESWQILARRMSSPGHGCFRVRVAWAATSRN
jgi:hypothetical protein